MFDRVRREQGRLSPGILAWSLALLLLPPMACSGTAAVEGEIASEEMQGDLIARLPAAVTTLGFVDFAAVRQSPLYDFLSEEGAAIDPEDFEDMIGQTGIDPRTDLHHVAFVSSSGPAEGLSGSGGAIVVATFDRSRVEEALADHSTEEYEGVTLYAVDEGTDSETDSEDDAEDDPLDEIDLALSRGVLAILDDATIAVGDGDTVRAIIDVAGGAPSVRTNEALMALQEDVDPGSQTWLVSAQNSIFGDISPGDTPMAQIPVDRINAMILSIQLTDGISFKLRGRTDAEADAKLLGDSLMGMLAFGKMMLQGNEPEVFAILDRALSAGSSGRDVTVRANLTMEDLTTLREFARRTLEGDSIQIGD